MTKRLTIEEQERLAIDFAYAAKKYLVDVGCVREADNVEPIWASTDDICEAIGAARIMWKSIRDQMLDLGIPLALAYYGGYYIGKDGEQLTLIQHKKHMIRGVANSCQEDIKTLARNGKSLEDVMDRARIFGVELGDIPKMLRALGSPLSPQIEIALIEAGYEENMDQD